ncbi:MAG: NAD(P)/FAD-dependent oxidoreductase [Gammaproteobacteria bacterium]|nr:NAD(P)/FAD-dependent oxidoreductase [Gammaproteobacteria bacterium]
MDREDVIVIGGGAAGLMCALTAGQRGRRVLLLDSANKLGKKILMSGGGRCNFTNLGVTPEQFLCRNPHFVKSALARYTQWDFIALVEKHGIAYEEREHGQLFCCESSRQIRDMLVAECLEAGVGLKTDCRIESVVMEDGYRLDSNLGAFSSESLVVASGGLSIPRMGATGFGFQLARQFGLEVLPTRAGLVPFTFTGDFQNLSTGLSGLSLDVALSCGDTNFEEALLFTHRGLSGPVVLQLSNYWQSGQEISINLLPGSDGNALLAALKQQSPSKLLRTLLEGRLPKNLVIQLQKLWWPELAERPIGEIADARLEAVAEQLQNWRVKPSGTEGYRTAEVTLGGVDTDQLSSRTMECKAVPGLYFIGEVVDVTGWLGGYNFQWAWSSGWAAGQVV